MIFKPASQVKSIFELNHDDYISFTLARVFVIQITYLCDIVRTVRELSFITLLQ